MTSSEAARILATLKDAYPRQELSAGTLTVYTKHLRKLDLPLASRAVQQHIGDSQFFPTIAELLSRAKALAPARTASEATVDDRTLVRLSAGQLAELKAWTQTIGRNVNDIPTEEPLPGEAWFREHAAEVEALTERAVAVDPPATYGALPMGEEDAA